MQLYMVLWYNFHMLAACIPELSIETGGIADISFTELFPQLWMEYLALLKKTKEIVMALWSICQQEMLMWEEGYTKEKAVSVKQTNKQKVTNIYQ